MRAGDFLSHSSEKALRVKEASHPEHIRATIENPIGELTVSFQELREPEPQSGGLPRNLRKDRKNVTHEETFLHLCLSTPKTSVSEQATFAFILSFSFFQALMLFSI